MTTLDNGRLMLLDTASMYFRAFFGVPEINAPDGTPVNAVRGLLDFITVLVADYRPTDLVCCWDNDWRPQWRVDLIPTYKAHRVVEEVASALDVEEVPDPLEVQVPIILEVLDALGIRVIGADHYEADDVIGTLATGAGQPVDIVTGDRDLFQLVDDEADVRVLYIARGVGNHERVTNEWVRAKYDIDARQYADFATMRGDNPTASPAWPGSGEDGRHAAEPLRRHERHPRRGARPGLRHGPRTTRQDQGGRGLPGGGADRGRRRPRARPRPQRYDVPSAPRDPEALAALARKWGLESPVERLLAVLR